jgi:hypothetical protein
MEFGDGEPIPAEDEVIAPTAIGQELWHKRYADT